MIYDISKSYAENAAHGPFFTGEIPKRLPVQRPIDFLGFTIHSPIGVPAGPLLNSRWISLASRLGFDVPTYKTIRSFAYPGHPLPNVIFVERERSKARKIQAPLSQLSITNSFGMPSMSPEFLMEDIAKANASLQKGQVMIVSVVGTPNRGVSYLEDFVCAAKLAKEAGAKIIEANFSCPNVGKEEGCLYMNPEGVFEFSKRIAEQIAPVPLILKVGSFSNPERMRNVFLAAARAGVRGICGLNSVSMEVVDANGMPALGASRKTSGICGDAIRPDALRFMQEAAAINRREKLELTLLGCGGLMLMEHLAAMLDTGAQIAMSATGMMWDPYLALRYHENQHAAINR